MEKCVYCSHNLYYAHPFCIKAENLTTNQIKKLIKYYNNNVDYKITSEFVIEAIGKRKLSLKRSLIDECDNQFICKLDNCYDDLNIDYTEVPHVIEHLEKKHSDFWNGDE